jgi:hypothetical protein
VEDVHDGIITVRPSVGDFVDQEVVAPGDTVDVVWKAPDTRRGMPAEVLEVETGAVVRWRLRAVGLSEPSQRRAAVRARVALPVVAGHGGVDLVGETMDLSENGIRGRFEGFGSLLEPGTTLALTVALEDGEIRTRAEVVRAHSRGARWLMSIRFEDIQEKHQDRVRRRVFQALREERARSVT